MADPITAAISPYADTINYYASSPLSDLGLIFIGLILGLIISLFSQK